MLLRLKSMPSAKSTSDHVYYLAICALPHSNEVVGREKQSDGTADLTL